MRLRGKIPSQIEKRLKMMLFGVSGSGKTTAALNFPKPYLIDTEKGAENQQYITLLEGAGGVIFQSSDFDEVYMEVRALSQERHDYRTLIIDPITVIYNKLVEDAEAKVGSVHGRQYGVANKRMQSLINLIMRLDMNVIITAHSKKEYGDNLIVLDNTFDGWKKLDYLFDLVLEIKYAHPDRIGLVRKSRLAGFEVGEKFLFSYKEISTRYGGHLLEREGEPVLKVLPDTLEKLKWFIEAKIVSDATLCKWFEKAEIGRIEDFTEIQASAIVKMIEEKEKASVQV